METYVVDKERERERMTKTRSLGEMYADASIISNLGEGIKQLLVRRYRVK